jgi:biopolymer transport protein ExbD
MIDVLLVLLIIFMAAIPSLRRSIDVQLPDRTAPMAPGQPSIVLEIDEHGAISINQSAVPRAELAARLREIYAARREKVLFVKGARRVRYAEVIHAMDVARGAGVKVLGIP